MNHAIHNIWRWKIHICLWLPDCWEKEKDAWCPPWLFSTLWYSVGHDALVWGCRGAQIKMKNCPCRVSVYVGGGERKFADVPVQILWVFSIQQPLSYSCSVWEVWPQHCILSILFISSPPAKKKKKVKNLQHRYKLIGWTSHDSGLEAAFSNVDIDSLPCIMKYLMWALA